jgi:hypothetical protein
LVDYRQSPDLLVVGKVQGVGPLGFGELACGCEIPHLFDELIFCRCGMTVRYVSVVWVVQR